MARPLRIGVNALYLIPGGVGGTEVYLRNLLQAIAANPRGHHFTIFRNAETGDDLAPQSPNFEIINTKIKATFRPARILYEQTLFLPILNRHKLDVLFNPGFTAPHLTGIPNVTILHDLQHHRHPEYFKPDDLLAWRLLVWAAAHKSKEIVTVSDASREDIHAVYNVPLGNIHTIEPGVEPEFFTLTREVAEPFILCVSTLHPHKNIERLVDAFARFLPNHPEYKLVLAGMRGFHGEQVEKRITTNGLTGQVRLTGWIPRAEVMDLYRRATFAVFPSTFEGFGMPVAEAMAAGLPLITSNLRPMKDIANGTATLFDPTNTGALVAAMEEVHKNPNKNTEKARQTASKYTWTRSAELTLNTLEKSQVKSGPGNGLVRPAL